MAEGWVIIHRKIQDCILWESQDPFDYRSAWIDLLLLANHEDKQIIFNSKPLTIKRGQRLTSMQYLAQRWKWDRKKVRKFLDLLQSENMLIRDSDKKRTLLTIVNYGVYQDVGTSKGQQKDIKRTSTGHQLPINNNDNNDNNDNKENIRHRHGEYKNVLLTDGEMETLRKEIPDLDQLIEELSSYMASSGKSYKSHLATLRNWSRRRAKEPKKDKEQKAVNKFGAFQNDNRNDLDALARRLTAN